MANWQTLAEVNSNARFNAGKDATTLTNADLLILANKYYVQIIRELISLGEDIYGEIATTALVSGQKEYSLPADSASTPFGGGSIQIMRVEVSHDGTNWYVAKPFDLDEVDFAIHGNTDATVNQHFSKTDPRYSYWDRSIWLFPIPVSTDSVAGGNTNLRIYWIKRPGELTATTDIPELPKDFLNILVEGMLIDVYRRFGRTSDSDRARLNFNQLIQNMKSLEVQVDERIQVKPSGNLLDYN